jgi:hypothetical protein
MFGIITMINKFNLFLLAESVSKDDFKKHLKELHSYMREKLEVDENPKIVLSSDKSNANDIFGKTAHYHPDTKTITLYTNERHPKDVLRSFAHEYIHHWQHLNQKFDPQDMNATDELGYAQTMPRLRELEREAFETGNMMFRDWCDGKKKEREPGIMKPTNEGKLPAKGTKKYKKVKTAIRKFEKNVSKKNFTDRYGKEKGEDIYYATAMKTGKKAGGVKEQDVDNVTSVAKEEASKHMKNKKADPSDSKMVHPRGIQESEKMLDSEMIYSNVDPDLGKIFKPEQIVRKDMKDAHDQARYEELLKKFGIKK